jgi:hypothetical protein
MNYSSVLWQWLVEVFLVSLVIFGLISLATGLGLIYSRDRTFRIFGVVNRWVSTRHVLKSVEVPHGTDMIAHRYRRWVGGAFVGFGVISIIGLVAKFDVAAISAVFGENAARPVIAWFIESTRWFLVVGSAFGVVVGAMLLSYPDAESVLERYVNRWVSSRRIVRNWDEMHMTLDKLVEAHPKPSGWVIAFASVAVVVSGLVMLVRV